MIVKNVSIASAVTPNHGLGTPRRAAGSWYRRIARMALGAIIVGSILLAAPLSPAWAKKGALNKMVVPEADKESNTLGYAIVLGALGVGLAVITRKSYRTVDPKRVGSPN
jgi:hypothetical protein